MQVRVNPYAPPFILLLGVQAIAAMRAYAINGFDWKTPVATFVLLLLNPAMCVVGPICLGIGFPRLIRDSTNCVPSSCKLPSRMDV